MKIALLFLGCILVVAYLLNRQRTTMNRIQARKRFHPDWSRTRAGSPRRRRSRFGSLRSEMARLEGKEASAPPEEKEAPASPPREPKPPDGTPSHSG